ncbi:Uncharacterised protein [Streptococcus pneumoniae]|nr:Uncharacterised protein [Streptococcus pneumoniae]
MVMENLTVDVSILLHQLLSVTVLISTTWEEMDNIQTSVKQACLVLILRKITLHIGILNVQNIQVFCIPMDLFSSMIKFTLMQILQLEAL